jgi:hypothetical protein
MGAPLRDALICAENEAGSASSLIPQVNGTAQTDCTGRFTRVGEGRSVGLAADRVTLPALSAT